MFDSTLTSFVWFYFKGLLFNNFNFCVTLQQFLHIFYFVFVVSLLVLKYPFKTTLSSTNTNTVKHETFTSSYWKPVFTPYFKLFYLDLYWTPQQIQHKTILQFHFYFQLLLCICDVDVLFVGKSALRYISKWSKVICFSNLLE